MACGDVRHEASLRLAAVLVWISGQAAVRLTRRGQDLFYASLKPPAD